MYLPYFLRGGLYDLCTPWGDSSLTQKEMRNTVAKYQSFRADNARVPPQIQTFMDDLHTSLIEGKFKAPKKGDERTNSINSPDALNLCLEVWYLYELDETVCNLSKSKLGGVGDEPIWIKIKSVLESRYSEFLNPHELIKYIGGISKLKEKKNRVERGDIFHIENSYHADIANLESARYFCLLMGTPRAELKNRACQMLVRWKCNVGLIASKNEDAFDEWALKDFEQTLAEPELSSLSELSDILGIDLNN